MIDEMNKMNKIPGDIFDYGISSYLPLEDMHKFPNFQQQLIERSKLGSYEGLELGAKIKDPMIIDITLQNLPSIDVLGLNRLAFEISSPLLLERIVKFTNDLATPLYLGDKKDSEMTIANAMLESAYLFDRYTKIMDSYVYFPNGKGKYFQLDEILFQLYERKGFAQVQKFLQEYRRRGYTPDQETMESLVGYIVSLSSNPNIRSNIELLLREEQGHLIYPIVKDTIDRKQAIKNLDNYMRERIYMYNRRDAERLFDGLQKEPLKSQLAYLFDIY